MNRMSSLYNSTGSVFEVKGFPHIGVVEYYNPISNVEAYVITDSTNFSKLYKVGRRRKKPYPKAVLWFKLQLIMLRVKYYSKKWGK